MNDITNKELSHCIFFIFYATVEFVFLALSPSFQGYSHGAMATVIFVATNVLYGVQCKCSHVAIVASKLNFIQ